MHQGSAMRHRNLLALLAISTATAAAMPARAIDSDDLTLDVRCMLVGANFAQGTDPALKSAGTMLSLYFMGKITGRQPDANLADLLTKQAGLMEGTDLRPEAQRCGNELTEAGARMKELGAEMIRRGTEQQKSSAPAAR